MRLLLLALVSCVLSGQGPEWQTFHLINCADGCIGAFAVESDQPYQPVYLLQVGKNDVTQRRDIDYTEYPQDGPDLIVGFSSVQDTDSITLVYLVGK
jgi:hypothetical protein